ncbi:hypothetical protein [Metabacillus litoralis]|nr:hypothetical protein [Metabacillus litoralis]
MKKIMSKWWVWVIVVLFVIMNILITNWEKPNDVKNEPRLFEGNIDSH